MMQSTDQNQISHQRKCLFNGANNILNTRSLEKNHERLSELIQPGTSVLDIGCGAGSITKGIAEKVTLNGQVIGVDLNQSLITEARHNYRHISNLTFEVGNIYDLPFVQKFDLVNAARIFHWLERPVEALKMMAKYVKPGGRIIVHEPNFEKLVWKPNPPNSVKTFYNAFLEWRTEMRMDNTIADKLSKMFEDAGFIDIVETPEHEVTNFIDPEFETRLGIWGDIMTIQGSQIVQNGLISEEQIFQAREDYRAWVLNSAEHQSVYLMSVDARLPA